MWLPPPPSSSQVPKAPPFSSLVSYSRSFATSPTSVIPLLSVKPEILHSCFRKRNAFILHADSAFSRSRPAKPKAARIPFSQPHSAPPKPCMVFRPGLSLGATPETCPGTFHTRHFSPLRPPLQLKKKRKRRKKGSAGSSFGQKALARGPLSS